MTQEEKQLLLKDLCARLLYGIFIHYHWSHEENTIDEDRELDFSDVETLKYYIENPQNDWCEISWKPYLRPMSSMTEEERYDYRHMLGATLNSEGESIMFVYEEDFSLVIDWLNEHHFDYRGLIEKNFALEASVDMYKTE